MSEAETSFSLVHGNEASAHL